MYAWTCFAVVVREDLHYPPTALSCDATHEKQLMPLQQQQQAIAVLSTCSC